MNNTIASAPRLAMRPATLLPAASRRHSGPATFRSTLATWSERLRFRWHLEQLAKESPHLIDDIGLTRQQFETEIAKRFWQA